MIPRSSFPVAVARVAAVLALAALPAAAFAQQGQVTSAAWTKPAWLTDLSLGEKLSYDDNVLLVSGLGLPKQTSWVNDVSLRVGVDFAKELGAGPALQTLSLTYQPEWVDYDQASANDYLAHRIGLSLKGKLSAWSYSLDNQFLYNDGNKTAETYAENQLGTGGNQDDKYRNNYSHSPVRERLNQDQDRYTASLQYDDPQFFFRPISQLTYYNLNTYQYNSSNAPYKGYQDYIDRWDINVGADIGYKLTSGLALTLGYRDGYQHQDQFSLEINSDQHFSSNHYQRLLFGLEGKVNSWLTTKLAFGPDFRDFNPDTPISDLKTTRLYGEGLVTATLASNQSLTASFKQWIFVSSTGLVPYVDTLYSLNYHLGINSVLSADLTGKFSEANYKLGNDVAGSAPSLRDDGDYAIIPAINVLVTPKLTVSVSVAYDQGRNLYENLPATLFADYRNFNHTVTSIGATYKF